MPTSSSAIQLTSIAETSRSSKWWMRFWPGTEARRSRAGRCAAYAPSSAKQAIHAGRKLRSGPRPKTAPNTRRIGLTGSGGTYGTRAAHMTRGDQVEAGEHQEGAMVEPVVRERPDHEPSRVPGQVGGLERTAGVGPDAPAVGGRGGDGAERGGDEAGRADALDQPGEDDRRRSVARLSITAPMTLNRGPPTRNRRRPRRSASRARIGAKTISGTAWLAPMKPTTRPLARPPNMSTRSNPTATPAPDVPMRSRVVPASSAPSAPGPALDRLPFERRRLRLLLGRRGGIASDSSPLGRMGRDWGQGCLRLHSTLG